MKVSAFIVPVAFGAYPSMYFESAAKRFFWIFIGIIGATIATGIGAVMMEGASSGTAFATIFKHRHVIMRLLEEHLVQSKAIHLVLVSFQRI